jgi:hypothetical protein
MAIGDVVRAAWSGLFDGQRVMTGFHIRFQGASVDMEDLAANMETNLLPALTNCVSSAVTFQEIVVQDVREDGPDTVHHGLTAGGGAVVGEAMPSFVSACFTVRTGLKGGRRRGRMYLPGLVEESVSAGQIVGTQVAQLDGYATTLLGLYRTGGSQPDFQWVVYSPEDLEAVPPRAGIITTPVTACSLNLTVATTNSRKIGRGA